MARRKLSDAERWQAVGMVSGGMSYRHTAERFNVSHSVIVRMKQGVNPTGSVKERQRTWKPLKTTPREDILLKRVARQQPFNTANRLWSRWIVYGRRSRRTVNRRLNHAKFRVRRPIKRLLLTIRHKTGRFKWTRDHLERISGRGRECTGRMKVVLCWILLMAAYAYGDRETHHFYRNILWAKLHLVEVVLLFGDAFL
jgi:transposase